MDNSDTATIEANRLKSSFLPNNPVIIPIAVGPDVDLDELRKIATDPSNVLNVAVNQVSALANQIDSILQTACPPTRKSHNFSVI